MEFPVNGAVLYAVANVECWTKQGSAFYVGGAFTTVSGQPSQQLLPSTNTTLGYYNGQMLANAVGDGTGMYAGLTAGALINFDPASTDTGQAIWNGLIICDPALKFPLPINVTYNGSLLVASPLSNWTIRQQFLYASGTPASDTTIVNTAIRSTANISTVQSQCMNSSGANEIIFNY